MSVSNPKKTVNKTSIACDGTMTVEIAFDAFSTLSKEPADIILIMDRSSSMNSGSRMAFAKKGANQLINMVAASSGTMADTIENGSRIGIVSFSSTAKVELPLSTDVGEISRVIDGLSPGGETNHRAAFQTALGMIDRQSTKDQIVIMFTDGITTTGGNPDAAAQEIKNIGGEIYCIGLVSDETNLRKWASDPADTHVAGTDDPALLQSLFENIALEVIKAGAHDVIIKEEINPDFKIIGVKDPSRGKVVVTSPQSIEWIMDAAGLTPDGRESFMFDIMHIGADGGIKEINKSISYSDRENNVLDFKSPIVKVDCGGTVINPEACPKSTSFKIDGCKDSVIVEALDAKLSSLGRIIQVDVPINSVCPNKRLAAAVILSELDANGVEHARGMKTFLIPAMSGSSCKDIILKCISFVVPEALDETGSKTSICNERSFKVRVMANYIDTDFVCCDSKTVIIK